MLWFMRSYWFSGQNLLHCHILLTLSSHTVYRYKMSHCLCKTSRVWLSWRSVKQWSLAWQSPHHAHWPTPALVVMGNQALYVQCEAWFQQLSPGYVCFLTSLVSPFTNLSFASRIAVEQPHAIREPMTLHSQCGACTCVQACACAHVHSVFRNVLFHHVHSGY